MISAIIISIFASFLLGMTNHIDKFVINGLDTSHKSIKTILVFSTLITGLIFVPIWFIICQFKVTISTISLIIIPLASLTYTLSLYLYYKALDKNEPSIIVIMYQLMPVFSYILSLIFLNENLTLQQIIGSLIIISSTIIILLDLSDKKEKRKLKFRALILMIFSSLLSAIYFILFDFTIRHNSYNSCIFSHQLSLLIIGIILINIKSFKDSFLSCIKNNGKKYISLNIFNDTLYISSNLLVHFANLTIPIALANVLNGFQGAFVFIIGVIGRKLFPKYFNEEITHKAIIQKIACIILSIIGLIIIFI